MVHVLPQKDFAAFLYVLLFEFIEKPFLVLTDYFENVMLYLAIRDDRKLWIFFIRLYYDQLPVLFDDSSLYCL